MSSEAQKTQELNIIKDVRVPAAFAEPDWVTETYKRFEKTIRDDYKSRGTIDHNLVRKSINEILLDGRVKAKWPLKKGNVSDLMQKMYEIFDNEEFQYRYYFIYRAGFFLSTYVAESFTPEALVLPEQFRATKAKIVKEYHERREEAKNQTEIDKSIIWVNKAFEDLTLEVLQYFRDHDYPISKFLDSGSKGSPDDLRKMLVATGLSINAKGEINDVIERSGSEGLSPTQFFNYSSQAIVSQYQKSHETAKPGYLIRQLNTIAAGVVLSKETDCGTKRFLSIKILNQKMLDAFDGKLRKTGTGLTTVSKKDKNLVGTTIKVRSPLYCEAEDGICVNCYNPAFVDRMHLKETSGIGLLASTAQAELLTNLTLKAAHTGLSLSKKPIDFTEDAFEFSE